MIPRDFDDQIEEPKVAYRPVVYAVAPSFACLALPKTDWAREGTIHIQEPAEKRERR